MLAEQTSLERLSFDLDYGAIDIPSSTLAFFLQELTLTAFRPDYAVAQLLQALTQHSASTLTRLSLRLDLSFEPYAHPQLSPFHNLNTIKLHLDTKTTWTDATERMERNRLLALFEGLSPSVQSMVLKGVIRGKPLLVIPLERLPPTLIGLDTRSIRFPPSTLLAYVRSPSSSICRLRYFDGGGPRGASSNDKWNEVSRRGVVSLLEELGIAGN